MGNNNEEGAIRVNDVQNFKINKNQVSRPGWYSNNLTVISITGANSSNTPSSNSQII